MSDIVIRAENLSKRYEIGERQNYLTLRDAIANVVSAPLRLFRARNGGGAGVPPVGGNGTAAPPVNNHGQDGHATGNGDATHIWALKDVSFEIRQGEVVGIIGRNGSGKSTLLKILSRVTKPTTGCADVRGRIGSLLEVGTGFHAELTGRENTYLNGAILGMSKKEVDRKFDEIVAFAEIEKFIDTPVKHYSSGMYVRLAFAVAAHLDTEILLVDEVLAVGDAAFQKKCLGKIRDASRHARTVLFVTHNMAIVNRLCPRVILVADGKIEREGRTADILASYLGDTLAIDNEDDVDGASAHIVWDDPQAAPGNDHIRLRSVRIVSRGATTAEVNIDEELSVEVEFWNYKPEASRICVNLYLLDSMGSTVLSSPASPKANSSPEEWFHKPHPVGLYRSTCTFPANFLNEARYYITVYVVSFGPMTIHAEAPQVLSFTVLDTGAMMDAGANKGWHGVVRVRLPWRTEYLGHAANGGNWDRADTAAGQ